MKVLIVDNGTRHLVALQRRFQDHDVRTIAYVALHRDHEDWADVIILSGGRVPILTHRLLYRRQINLLRSSSKPIVGICLGHELIGLAYGVRPHRLFRRVKGLRNITVNRPGVDLDEHELKVWEAHKWSLKSVPVAL